MSILDFLTLSQPFSIPQRKFEPVNKAKLKVHATLNESLLPLLECTPTSVLSVLVSSMLLQAFQFSAHLAVSGKLKTLQKLRPVCIWACYSPTFASCSLFSFIKHVSFFSALHLFSYALSIILVRVKGLGLCVWTRNLQFFNVEMLFKNYNTFNKCSILWIKLCFCMFV